MKLWAIVDQRGDFVLDLNRRLPRLYTTKTRAEEKIKHMFQVGKWHAYQVRVVLV